MDVLLHMVYEQFSHSVPDPLANSAQWQELTEQTLSLEKLLHSQLDAQGREALDKMPCLEGQRLDLWMEELFSTGICLGLELGRLSSAQQAPDPLTAPCVRWPGG